MVLLGRQDSEEIQCHVFTQGQLVEVDLVEVSSDEIDAQCQVIRVCGNLTLCALKTQADIQNAFKHLIEKVPPQRVKSYKSLYHLWNV